LLGNFPSMSLLSKTLKPKKDEKLHFINHCFDLRFL